MTLIDALEMLPLRTRRLPCVSYEALVRGAVGTALRPTVDSPVAPAPRPAVGLKGNGSPVIQPGYRKGLAPGNAGKKFPPTVIPRKGKGGKSGFAAVDQPALEYLDVWLAWRAIHKGIDRHCPVFCTIADGYGCRPINSAYVRRMLKQLAVKAGVDRRVTPHAFRHSLAAGLMDEGADIRVVSKQLRHSNIAVTANYVDHLPAGRVLDVVRSRPWPLDERTGDV